MHTDIIGIFDWIKHLPHDIINLANSGVAGPLTAEELGLKACDLPVSGDNYYGYKPLKERLAEIYKTDPEHIAITLGASLANYAVMEAILDDGDRVTIESPAYQPFINVAEAITSRQADRVQRKSENSFQLNRSILSEIHETKLLILSNLHNPSGAMDSKDILINLADKVAEYGGWTLIDEVFLPFKENWLNLTSAVSHERIITTCSLTKAWGLGGLRIGWVVADPEIIRKINYHFDYLHVNQPMMTDYIGWFVLNHQDLSDQLLGSARRQSMANWEIVREYLKAFTQIDWVKPDGGVVVFVWFKDGRDSTDFCRQLHERFNTVVTPGIYFDFPSGFRIGFSIDQEVLIKGLENLKILIEETYEKL